MSYEPVNKHWFYEADEDNWLPFSNQDSSIIQQSYENNGPEIISTDSGRFDVNIKEKIRIPIYWKAEINQIRYCSWFYKNFNKKYIPYDEDIANLLEDEYKNALINNKWNTQVNLPNEQIILLQAPKQIYHFLNIEDISQYFWNEIKPGCIVRRGLEKFKIKSNDDDNNKKIDHLLFVVHGITSGAVLKFRSDVEVVEQVRVIASKLIKSNYTNLYDQGTIGNIEVLPVSWQDQIHSPDSKIDEKLKTITLESLPKFRNMANYSILDVLSYTSPIYCQNIMTTVGNSINENYKKFCKRNKDFNGEVSLVGHSLGALILFDLLCNQRFKSIASLMSQTSAIYAPIANLNRAGTGQVIVNYPQLLFEPQICFALGSPIGLFVTLRDTISLGLHFKLPTCLGFYNIFHPFDPVAYRMEGLVNPLLGNKQPIEIPYHKGGKRKHIEIKDTMKRVKNDIKDKVFVAYKNILEKIAASSSSSSPKNDKETNEEIKKEVDEILEFQITNEELLVKTNLDSTLHLNLGKLNNSKRIDYVLQSRSFEVNEYLFALNSHICYWESEDTILFMIKEIYASLNIALDTENMSTTTN